MHEYYKREGEGRVFPFELQFAQDLLHLKTSLWFLIYGGAIPKQPTILRQTLKDMSNE